MTSKIIKAKSTDKAWSPKTTKMALDSYLQVPQQDLMGDEKLHKRYLDLQEEVNLILAAPLREESKTVKVNCVLNWAGKTARGYVNSRPDVDKSWPNEKAAFTSLRTLYHGTLNLSEFIQKQQDWWMSMATQQTVIDCWDTQ